MVKGIAVIGFDLDNTLYPSTPEMQTKIRGKIYERLSSELGIDFERARELFEEHYGGNYPWSHSGSRTIAELARRHGKNIYADVVQQALERAEILEFIKPNPSLVNMLERLSKRYELDIVTGSAYKLAEPKLERIGIDKKLFGHFLADIGSKSDGTAFRTWIDLRRVSPQHMLYVGDNFKQDIESAARMGIKTCLLGKENFGAELHVKDILDLEGKLAE